MDVLVNNAGFAWFGPTEKLPADTLNQLFAANVQAPYLLVSVLAPKNGGPRARRHHQRGQQSRHRRSTHDCGLQRRPLSSLAVPGPPSTGHGVRVNAISPGPVYTNAADRELFDSLGEKTVLGRAGDAPTSSAS